MSLDMCNNLKGCFFNIFGLAYFDVQKFYFWKLEVIKSYGHLKAILLRKDSRLVILLHIQGLEDLRASSTL